MHAHTFLKVLCAAVLLSALAASPGAAATAAPQRPLADTTSRSGAATEAAVRYRFRVVRRCTLRPARRAGKVVRRRNGTIVRKRVCRRVRVRVRVVTPRPRPVTPTPAPPGGAATPPPATTPPPAAPPPPAATPGPATTPIPLTPPAPGGRVLHVDAACPAGGDGTTASCGGARGAYRTLTAAHAAVTPGDVVRVRSGVYDEGLVYTRGGTTARPVVWETAGDGPVTWRRTSTAAGQPFINDWSGSMIFAPSSPGASHVTFRGRPGSAWVLDRATSVWWGGAIVLYGDASGTRTTDWTFQHVRITGGATRAATISAWRVTFEDIEVRGNGTGLVFLAENANITRADRPWSGHVVRRCVLADNDSGGNDDGLIIQDLDGVLVERCVIGGQYDGLDSGSQGTVAGGAIGPRWVIARFNTATGRNGVMPVSTVARGPVSLLYNTIRDNGNWGAVPVYEGSGNVHLWNNAFVNNLRAVNVQSPTTGVVHFVNNVCRAGPLGRLCLDANGNAVVKRANALLDGAVHANPATAGTGDVTGAAGTADSGAFFLRAASDVTGTVLVTAPSYPGGAADPRTFFWVGDVVRIAGAGTRTVTAVTPTSITLDAPVTVAAGAGLHYAYQGSGPDIGRGELPD